MASELNNRYTTTTKYSVRDDEFLKGMVAFVVLCEHHFSLVVVCYYAACCCDLLLFI